MRIALAMGLAPRKLGSFEAWLVALCEEARRRGHTLDLFGQEPTHPVFRERLERAGGAWGTLAELEASLLQGVRRLARYDVVHLNLCAPRSRICLMAQAAWPAKVVFVEHTSGGFIRRGGLRHL